MNEFTLILPNQLFEDHPALLKGRKVVLCEEPLLFGNDDKWPVNIHKKRLILYRASMRAYREYLEEQGYEVNYIKNAG